MTGRRSVCHTYSLKRLLTYVGTALLLALLGPVASLAQTHEEMPVTSAAPANGAVFPTTTGLIGFHVASPYNRVGSMFVEISTQSLPGQDGTLANDFQVDAIRMLESDAFPGNYTGSSTTGQRWSQYPGTYYWQASGFCFDVAIPHCNPSIRLWKTRVYTLTIQAPAAPPPPPPSSGGGSGGQSKPNTFLSSRQASRYINRMLAENVSGRVRALKKNCVRLSRRTFRCSLRWRTKKATYSGTAKLWHDVLGDEVFSNYSFVGRKRALNCTSNCTKRVRFY